MDNRRRELANKLHQHNLQDLMVMYGYDIPREELLHALERQHLEDNDDDL